MGMKRKMVILFMFLTLLVVMVALNTDGNNNSTEPNWAVSRTFKFGEHTMIGQPSKLGIIEATFIAGKQQGIHWFFWGDQSELVKGTFKLIAQKRGLQPIILVENSAIAYGTKGAEAQVPMLLTLPSDGLWKLNVYIDNKLYGSVVVKVYK
jgi:hypothetical protein